MSFKMGRELDAEDGVRMKLPKALWGAQFKYVQPSAKVWLRNYLTDLKEYMTKGTSLVIIGDEGVGKSCIASLIARYVRSHAHSVYWTTAWRYREDRRSRARFDDELSVLERVQTVDLLVIDDLEEEDLEDRYYGLNELRSLMAQRDQERKSTVVTSRLPLGDPEYVRLISSMTRRVVMTVEGEDLRQKVQRDLENRLMEDK